MKMVKDKITYLFEFILFTDYRFWVIALITAMPLFFEEYGNTAGFMGTGVHNVFGILMLSLGFGILLSAILNGIINIFIALFIVAGSRY